MRAVIGTDGLIKTFDWESVEKCADQFEEALNKYKKLYLGSDYNETDRNKVINDIRLAVTSKIAKTTEGSVTLMSLKQKRTLDICYDTLHILDIIEEGLNLIEKTRNANSNEEKPKTREEAEKALSDLFATCFGNLNLSALINFDEEAKVVVNWYSKLDEKNKEKLHSGLMKDFIKSLMSAYNKQLKATQEKCDHEFAEPVEMNIVYYKHFDPCCPRGDDGDFFTETLHRKVCNKCGLVIDKTIKVEQTHFLNLDYDSKNAIHLANSAEEFFRTKK